jgi:transposase-like protein
MPWKFTFEPKEQIVIESFTATNIAEPYCSYGVSVAKLYRWREQFLGGRKKGTPRIVKEK